MTATQVLIPLLLTSLVGLIGCEPASKPNYISAFEPIKIEQQPALYNSNVNKFVIKNVSFGAFGAQRVTVTLKNVPVHVRGSIEFKLDHPSRPSISTVQLSTLDKEQSTNYFNLTSDTKSKAGVHDLYVSLPLGLHPSNIESILYAPVQYPNEDQWYYIINSVGNRPITVTVKSGVSNVMYWKFDDSIWTHFAFEKVREAVYKIIARVTGEVLTVPGNSKNDVFVSTEVFKNEDGQLWKINPTVYGTVYFHPLHELSKTLTSDRNNQNLDAYLKSSNATYDYPTQYYLVPVCSDLV